MRTGLRAILICLLAAACYFLPSLPADAHAADSAAQICGIATSSAISAVRPGSRAASIQRHRAMGDATSLDARDHLLLSGQGYRNSGSSGDDCTLLVPTIPAWVARTAFTSSLSRRGPPVDLRRPRASSTPSSPRDPPAVLL